MEKSRENYCTYNEIPQIPVGASTTSAGPKQCPTVQEQTPEAPVLVPAG